MNAAVRLAVKVEAVSAGIGGVSSRMEVSMPGDAFDEIPKKRGRAPPEPVTDHNRRCFTVIAMSNGRHRMTIKQYCYPES